MFKNIKKMHVQSVQNYSFSFFNMQICEVLCHHRRRGVNFDQSQPAKLLIIIIIIIITSICNIVIIYVIIPAFPPKA